MAGVERYGPGDEAKDLVPGDFILSHRHHLIAGLISLAQRRCTFDRGRTSHARRLPWLMCGGA
jgi:hypothetical protein